MAPSSLNTTAISFEFFPPKNSEGDNKLLATARALKGYRPAFVSVTFGALGSTSTRTPDSVALLQKEGLVDVAPHLTVVGLDKAAIVDLLDTYKAQGVKRIVALRGDKQEGSVMAFPYASHLVAFIRQRYGNHFHIEVAAYPEVHPEATSARDDLFHLKEKWKRARKVPSRNIFTILMRIVISLKLAKASAFGANCTRHHAHLWS